MNNQFHYTVSSKKNTNEVVKDLESALKEEKFGVLWEFPVHEKLREKELPINKNITILEVCNPMEASNILEIDPLVSYFLPCKIIVMEEENGTKVGLIRPSALIGMMEKEELIQSAKNIEDRLIATIDKTV